MKHAITVLFLSAGAAAAHGGHEEAIVQGDVHWLTTGDHAIVLLLAGIAVGLIARPVLRRLHRVLARA